MSSLRDKSAEELCRLLDEYGIKHGPVVDSTRKLYEKKLTDAMSKNAKPSPDKTYYREEQDDITYVTYHPPKMKYEESRDVSRRLETTHYDEEVDSANEPIISRSHISQQSTPRFRPPSYTSKSSTYNASPVSAKSEASKSGGAPGWLRVLVFIIIALILYFVYSSMESTEESPIKSIDK